MSALAAPVADARLGLAWMVASTALFVATEACIKHASAELHPFVIAFWRNVFGLLFLLPLLARNNFAVLRVRAKGLMLARGVCGVAATLTFFYALSAAPLVDVIAVSFLTPILAVVLSAVFLGEPVSKARWLCIGLAFAGALVVVRPGIVVPSIGLVAALAAVVFNALVALVIKRLSRTETSLSIAAWMCVTVGVLTLPAALPFWSWPAFDQLLWLAAIGVLATSAQFAIAQSLRLGDMSVMMPADFLKLVWAAALGVLVFAERIDPIVVGGAAMIVAANVASGFSARQKSARP